MSTGWGLTGSDSPESTHADCEAGVEKPEGKRRLAIVSQRKEH